MNRAAMGAGNDDPVRAWLQRESALIDDMRQNGVSIREALQKVHNIRIGDFEALEALEAMYLPEWMIEEVRFTRGNANEQERS